MINTVVLMGRLTKAPELRTTNSGISVTSFTVAVDRSYQKAGEDKQTDFINCVAWKQTAEFVSKYFGKGDMIALNGELHQRSYTDKDGNKRTAYDVVANNISFCGGKKDSAGDIDITSADDFEEIGGVEDLPFN